MNMKRNSFWFVLLCLIACGRDNYDDPIPFVPFLDVVIDLNFPEYQNLQQLGYTTVGGGARGIIVYRQSASLYIAYERNCSFRPAEACATVGIHTSGLFMIDDCCGSSFDFANGNPTGGPAWRPLNRYRTTLSGNTLTITSELIN